MPFSIAEMFVTTSFCAHQSYSNTIKHQ